MAKIKIDPKKTSSEEPKKAFDLAFGKENYLLMIIGIALLALGYILMIGGGSKDFNEFNESLFDFRRLVLAPLVLLAGFIVEIVAIMKKPRD